MAMNPDEETELVATAVREAYAAVAFEPLPPAVHEGRPVVRPVPLEQILAAMGIVRIEVQALTRATAAAELAAWNLDRPDLLNDPTPLAGLLFVTAGGGCVLVRRDDPLPRRRFSAAHELGHYLMHHRPEWLADDEPDAITDDEPEAVIEAAPDDDAIADPALVERERQANRFAAELLMPAALCRHLHQFYEERYGATPQFIEGHMAGDLLVSRQATRYRLQSLRLSKVV
jgi:hypothetical protein